MAKTLIASRTSSFFLFD